MYTSREQAEGPPTWKACPWTMYLLFSLGAKLQKFTWSQDILFLVLLCDRIETELLQCHVFLHSTYC